jgi:RNA polymerase sigma-70 factor (family 1)
MSENLAINSDEDSFSLNPITRPLGRIIDDEIFIKKAFETDVHKGFELLYNRYYKPLCSHAVRFVYSREVAEDIIGEIFFGIWKNELYLNINTSFRAYLFTATRNRCYQYLSQESGKTSSFDNSDYQIEHSGTSAEQILFYDDLQQQIQHSIVQLSPQCQKVFLMSRLDGKKNKDIADELQLAPKTVEAHITKALSFLKKVVLDNPSFWGLIIGTGVILDYFKS